MFVIEGLDMFCLANVPSGSVPLNQHFEAILSVACPPVVGPPERNFGKLQKAEYKQNMKLGIEYLNCIYF